MSHTCAKCSRVNPDDAVYCYFDGAMLGGRAQAGPVAVGAQPFPAPFVFPSGRTCRSFDELALACQQDWQGSRELLQQGFLGSFFGGLGRGDLARAADAARRFPDPDRGLDQLLAKLPGGALERPRVRVHPREVNLGVLRAGEDRVFNLHLENQGMRLVYGNVTAEDCPWLTLGDAPGAAEKIVQFTHETTIPVHVRGNKLRAGSKPVEGRLVIDTNGGDPVIVTVRAEVPVKPFPGSSVLAGARSPRQVAEKARDNPKVAAQLFEKGEVARWYESNGWTYPVRGPSASGMGAVQQFFEALGLTPPPKVEISERAVALRGEPGHSLRHVLKVRTPEKRPVYAHGSSNQPWLEVSRATLNGRVAKITLVVPAVPDRPGETLAARVVVQANGNQRFVVPVTLHISNSLDFTAAGAAPEPIPEPVPLTAEAPDVPFLPVAAVAAAGPVIQSPSLRVPRKRGGAGSHLLPAAALGLALLVLVVIDLTRRESEEGGNGVEPPVPATKSEWLKQIEGLRPQLTVDFNDDQRFGLLMVDHKDPKNPKKQKQLTFDEQGQTNNTRVKIDNFDYIFGRVGGQTKWVEELKELVPRRAWRSTMRFGDHQVLVSQYVILVPGQSGELDTCLIYYEVKNEANSPRHVALRVMLDTYIGANDGVPFTIPGREGFLDTMEVFPQKEVPAYIEAVENPEDPDAKGTVARLGLRGVKLPDVDLDEPVRMVVCRYPENPQADWEWEFTALNEPEDRKDSCVALYWAEEKLNPGGERFVGFTYGLSTLDIGEGAAEETRLGLSVPANNYVDAPFVVTAYVYNAKEGQKVTLELPDGLELAGGEAAEKEVGETARRTTVFWNVRATRTGKFPVKARSGNSESKPVNVVVRSKSIFG